MNILKGVHLPVAMGSKIRKKGIDLEAMLFSLQSMLG